MKPANHHDRYGCGGRGNQADGRPSPESFLVPELVLERQEGRITGRTVRDVLPSSIGIQFGPRGDLADNRIARTALALRVRIIAEDRFLNSTADSIKLLLWCLVHPNAEV